MAGKIQRWRDTPFGMMADDDGDFVSVHDVDELADDARDILFDSPQSKEFEDGVNALIKLIRIKE